MFIVPAPCGPRRLQPSASLTDPTRAFRMICTLLVHALACDGSLCFGEVPEISLTYLGCALALLSIRPVSRGRAIVRFPAIFSGMLGSDEAVGASLILFLSLVSSVYTYIHTYIHTYIICSYTYIHNYVSTYLPPTYLPTYVYVCVYIYHIHIHIHLHVHVHIHSHIHIYPSIHPSILPSILLSMYILLHTACPCMVH